jgi:hypothetical protein
MIEYEIQAPTRRCAATGRELQTGDRFYTALLDVDGKLIRQDYCAEAWQGPPEGVFSFWMGRVRPPEESHRLRIDDDILFECFQRLEGQVEPDKVSFRYVVALLLMRRKRLKFEEARKEAGHELLSLRCVKSRNVHQVVNPLLSEEQLAVVQEEVFKVLGWE